MKIWQLNWNHFHFYGYSNILSGRILATLQCQRYLLDKTWRSNFSSLCAHRDYASCNKLHHDSPTSENGLLFGCTSTACSNVVEEGTAAVVA